jgi:hypothetical protein
MSISLKSAQIRWINSDTEELICYVPSANYSDTGKRRPSHLRIAPPNRLKSYINCRGTSLPCYCQIFFSQILLLFVLNLICFSRCFNCLHNDTGHSTADGKANGNDGGTTSTCLKFGIRFRAASRIFGRILHFAFASTSHRHRMRLLLIQINWN